MELVYLKDYAYQEDTSNIVSYDEDYFNKCLGYEDQDIALKINKGRIDLVDKYHNGFVLDVGVGSGEFVKKRFMTMGYDINPHAVEWMKLHGYYSDHFEHFKAFTFWDVIEHLPEPDEYFSRIRQGGYLFTSIPLFSDLSKIKESKHYRPNEHLWYFTKKGFIDWMRNYGFALLEIQEFEKEAGREEIYSFAFQKCLTG